MIIENATRWAVAAGCLTALTTLRWHTRKWAAPHREATGPHQAPTAMVRRRAPMVMVPRQAPMAMVPRQAPMGMVPGQAPMAMVPRQAHMAIALHQALMPRREARPEPS